MHPLFRKLYTFGGVGRRAIADIELFDEETLEFAKLSKYSGKPLGVKFTNTTNLSRHGSNQPNPAGAMKQRALSPYNNGDSALRFSGPGDAGAGQPQAEGHSEAEQKLENGRFYHLMLPYKNYLCVYGGQSNTGGHAHRGYRPVQCEIFLYDLLRNRWSELKPSEFNRIKASRRNHCGAILNQFLLVYGGVNTCVQYQDDLQVFNFETLAWGELIVGGKQRPAGLARSRMQSAFHR